MSGLADLGDLGGVTDPASMGTAGGRRDRARGDHGPDPHGDDQEGPH